MDQSGDGNGRLSDDRCHPVLTSADASASAVHLDIERSRWSGVIMMLRASHRCRPPYAPRPPVKPLYAVCRVFCSLHRIPAPKAVAAVFFPLPDRIPTLGFLSGRGSAICVKSANYFGVVRTRAKLCVPSIQHKPPCVARYIRDTCPGAAWPLEPDKA